MTLLIQPGIMDVQPYVGGASKIQGKAAVMKLSSNESPLGASPKAIEAFRKTELHRYPDGGAILLRKAIAEVYQMQPEQIVCGAGSDEIISLLCQAFAGVGDEVLYSEHGFLMYGIYARVAGAKPVQAPEKNLTTDVDALLAAVTPRTRIVFIANPNNPTGSYIPAAEMQRLRARLPEQVVLAIDGAYTEYVSRSDYSDGRELVDAGGNTVVLRTFSKIYGLSALRLGWSYCPPAIADVLNRVRGPFNVSAPAQAAGAAAVRDTAFIAQAKAHNDRWLPWLGEQLTALGLHVYPSVGNFILVRFPGGKAAVEKADAYLRSQGIIVRPVANYGLTDCLRITVGLEEENKAVVEALRAFLA